MKDRRLVPLRTRITTKMRMKMTLIRMTMINLMRTIK